jgi:hypothetical protein
MLSGKSLDLLAANRLKAQGAIWRDQLEKQVGTAVSDNLRDNEF